MTARAPSPPAPTGSRRARWRRLVSRRALARYEPLAWQSIAVGVACPLILEALVAIGGVVREDRSAWVHACSVSLVAFAVLAAVTGRVGRWSLRAQCLEAFAMVVVLGTSTAHLGVLSACAVTLVLVLVSAAAHLPAAEVVGLTGVGGAAFAVLMVGQGYGGWSLALTVAAVMLLAGVPAAILFAFRTRIEAAVEQARTMSRTDALTGLLNRRGLAEAARDLVARARDEQVLVGALLVDVDRFKDVNDVYGHTAGDEVLRRVAEVVRDACGPDDVVARFGGEELCVLLLRDDPGALPLVGERLRVAVEQADTRPSVTVSVGGAGAVPEPLGPDEPDPDGQDAEDLVMRLVDRADAVLYEVKRSGRNGVRVHGDAAPRTGAVPRPAGVPRAGDVPHQVARSAG